MLTLTHSGSLVLIVIFQLKSSYFQFELSFRFNNNTNLVILMFNNLY